MPFCMQINQMDAEGPNYCYTLNFIGPMGGTNSPIIGEPIFTDNSSLFTAITVSHKPQDSAIFIGDDRGHLRKVQ